MRYCNDYRDDCRVMRSWNKYEWDIAMTTETIVGWCVPEINMNEIL